MQRVQGGYWRKGRGKEGYILNPRFKSENSLKVYIPTIAAFIFSFVEMLPEPSRGLLVKDSAAFNEKSGVHDESRITSELPRVRQLTGPPVSG